jgi:hypothetical protein
MKVRCCDRCQGKFGLIRNRYYGHQFCSKQCLQDHQLARDRLKAYWRRTFNQPRESSLPVGSTTPAEHLGTYPRGDAPKAGVYFSAPPKNTHDVAILDTPNPLFARNSKRH